MQKLNTGEHYVLQSAISWHWSWHCWNLFLLFQAQLGKIQKIPCWDKNIEAITDYVSLLQLDVFFSTAGAALPVLVCYFSQSQMSSWLHPFICQPLFSALLAAPHPKLHSRWKTEEKKKHMWVQENHFNTLTQLFWSCISRITWNLPIFL